MWLNQDETYLHLGVLPESIAVAKQRGDCRVNGLSPDGSEIQNLRAWMRSHSSHCRKLDSKLTKRWPCFLAARPSSHPRCQWKTDWSSNCSNNGGFSIAMDRSYRRPLPKTLRSSSQYRWSSQNQTLPQGLIQGKNGELRYAKILSRFWVEKLLSSFNSS